jgi:hypothetical protein
MKAYKFIFFVGILNLTIPFLGIPFVYKNYALLALAVITIAYALILRAVEKEKQIIRETREYSSIPVHVEKTIEDVVEMVETPELSIAQDVHVKRRGRRPKVIAETEV